MDFKKFKKQAIEIMSTTTCHGIPNIIKARKNPCLAFMWTVSFLVCTGYFSYLTIISIQNYLSYQVITSINIVNESPTLFPTVTLCNLNGFFLKADLINETLISCRFNNQPCSFEDILVAHLSSYGNCLRFNYNPNDLKKTYVAGKYTGGLILELFAGVPDNFSSLSQGYGFHIFVHNITDKIVRIVKGVDVAPGFQTNLVIERIFYKKETIPYDDCFNDIDLYYKFNTSFVDELLKTSLVYQQSECLELCKHKMLQFKCNCDTFTNNTYVCINNNSQADMNCVYKTNNYFYISNYTECLPLCPLECDTQEFKISTSFLNYPHLSKVNGLLNNPIIKNKYENISNVTVNQLRESILSVAIYYDDLSYTVISKEPKMNLLDLISAIGGIMGIFLGISFLSFLEIIELIFMLFFSLITQKDIFK
jgi:amiloride-sensitive sodium channel subunit alpha